MNEVHKLSILEFCDRFNACRAGREWAVENCQSMEEAWDQAKPGWLVWIATRDGVIADRDVRLFACWCVRQAWHLLRDDLSRRAVEVSERYANGDATEEELSAARSSASSSASAAWMAAAEAAEAAAAAAWAAWAESAVAREAAWMAQADYLRDLGNPFRGVKAREAEECTTSSPD